MAFLYIHYSFCCLIMSNENMVYELNYIDQTYLTVQLI